MPPPPASVVTMVPWMWFGVPTQAFNATWGFSGGVCRGEPIPVWFTEMKEVGSDIPPRKWVQK